jgi:hypothetical protein
MNFYLICKERFYKPKKGYICEIKEEMEKLEQITPEDRFYIVSEFGVWLGWTYGESKVTGGDAGAILTEYGAMVYRYHNIIVGLGHSKHYCQLTIPLVLAAKCRHNLSLRDSETSEITALRVSSEPESWPLELSPKLSSVSQ